MSENDSSNSELGKSSGNCESNEFDALDKLLPRYVRVWSGSSDFMQSLLIKNAPLLSRVKWSNSFLAFPGCHSLNDIDWLTGSSYKDASVFPMDASSSLAISALDMAPSQSPRKVLDLCCSPGAKYQMLAEALDSRDLLVGVDISLPRIDTCKVLLSNTYNNLVVDGTTQVEADSLAERFPRQLIFQCDGTTFGPGCLGEVQYDSSVLFNEIAHNMISSGGKRKRVNKSARMRERKALRLTQEALFGTARDAAAGHDDTEPVAGPSEVKAWRDVDMAGFDYVLVDAECTHDASYRHMRYVPGPAVDSDARTEEDSRQVPSSSLKPKASLSHTTTSSCTGPTPSAPEEVSCDGSVPAPSTADKLQALQRGLLWNGFRLLRPGGTLVYSTCSQETAQNEEVVLWLLQQQCPDTSEIVPLNFGEAPAVSCAESKTVEELLSRALPDIASHAASLTADAFRELSGEVCRHFCSLDAPAVTPSSLSGTVRIDFRGGMSGHYIAKIRKCA